ncbi:MAG: hypothetical protein HY902_03195 [Deltaproteobacteria bacterium]|nr:hypothetical protein [Deltaproteobacteria bacterium]
MTRHHASPAHSDPVETFEKIERIELIAAELFHLLAARFADQPERAELFIRLEKQEIQHALRVRMACRDFLVEHGRNGTWQPDEAKLDAMILQGEQALERFAGERPKISFDEALAVTQRLESELAGSHAALTEAESDPHLKAFFALLSEQDRALQKTLAAKRAAK